jgi:hypothetical protein
MAQKTTTKTLIPGILALTLTFSGVASADKMNEIMALDRALNNKNPAVVCHAIQRELNLADLQMTELKKKIQASPFKEGLKLSVKYCKLIKLRNTLKELFRIHKCI